MVVLFLIVPRLYLFYVLIFCGLYANVVDHEEIVREKKDKEGEEVSSHPVNKHVRKYSKPERPLVNLESLKGFHGSPNFISILDFQFNQ
jgi:hypothetical protein